MYWIIRINKFCKSSECLHPGAIAGFCLWSWYGQPHPCSRQELGYAVYHIARAGLPFCVRYVLNLLVVLELCNANLELDITAP